MPAQIDLHLTLPDGEVAAKRNYPMDAERRSLSDLARQADERDWVASELPGAIELLYARAGLEHPDGKIGGLLQLLPGDVPREEVTLSAVVATFSLVRDALHEMAIELGVDMATRQVDSHTGTLTGAANLPRLAKQKAGDLKRIRENYDRLAAKIAELAGAFPVSQRLSGVQDHPLEIVDATLEALADRAREIDQRGRVIDAVKDALRVSRDDTTDADVAALVTQLADASEHDMARRLARLATMFGFPKDFDDMDKAVARQLERTRTEGIEQGRREALYEVVRTFQIHDETDDPLEVLIGIYGQQRRLGQLDVLGGLGIESDELPADADVVTWARRAWDTWYDEAVQKGSQRHVKEAAILRNVLGEIGTVFKVLAPMTRNALVNGTLSVEDVKSVAGEVQTQVAAAWAEMAILRYLAHDVALITGASQADAAKLTNATLPPQQLANRLNEYKRVLRRDGAVAERDASRRIVEDIARKLGNPDLRETLVPGAVGDLVRTAEARAVVLSGVRGQLAELRTGLPKCPDEQLPGLVRQTVLADRYPIGATVQLPNGVLGMVIELSADATSELPIKVRYEDESTIWMRPSEVRGVERRSMSGEFHAADGVKPKGFTLPEDGLADILAKVRTPKLPSMDKVDAAADRLADRIETWGERVASRINSAANRLAEEIDEAVENAREKGGK